MPAAVALLLLVFVTSSLLSQPQPPHDELALLAFKSMLSTPAGVSLPSWNTSSPCCSWPGVVCSVRRRHPVVIALLLRSQNLSGRISPSLGNLSFLRELDLSSNHLTGEIPLELGRLARLRTLNLSRNSFRGDIVGVLGGSSSRRLITLDVNTNKLQGTIPGRLPNLTSMEYLNLGSNVLTGEIPACLGNLSNLWRLTLAANQLSGEIPSSLGLLPKLSWFSLGYNNLSGVMPTSIWNVSSLTFFSVQRNMLTGTIPPDAFNTLHNLQTVAIDHNQFYGHLPASIANASGISLLQLYYNNFTGIVPPEVGRLSNLYWLQISANSLQAQAPKDWEFIAALTNCSQLQVLELGSNKFEGVISDSLSNLSTSLTYLSLSGNRLSGSIPRDVGNLINLQELDLSNNSFTGILPSSLTRLKHLAELYVSENKISGSIPWAIGNLTELTYLNLSNNGFGGMLPSTLGNLTKLLALNLERNNFVGPIPIGLFDISTISITLDLSHNNLEGSIPEGISNLKNLVEFHAESNRFSGEIPADIGECQLLLNLYLQNNNLTGRIPSSMSQLKGLENLDISSNNLSGDIPKFLVNISMLCYLNISFNNFVGEVPNSGVFRNTSAVSIQGNGRLCGGLPNLHLTPCSSQLEKTSHKSRVLPIVIPLIATMVILSLIICILFSRRKTPPTEIPSTTFMQDHLLITYPQLVRATDGFSTTNLLGSGAFGTVFKADIGTQGGESTNVVAVKVLKLETPGALKSFVAECEALRHLRHRNLVKIITACSSIDNKGNDFKAIVFDFMPNGSLQDWLHPDTNDQTDKYLNLLDRVSILLDVANALGYLHCHGHAPVLHCDLKPSNVLLDAEMVAHLGDFGLAKIILDTSSFPQQSTSSMGFRGTIGYAAPEYGAGNMVSTHADIYSYGILVLETVTGRKPTDSKFTEGLSLRQYVEIGLHGRVMDVADSRLFLRSLQNELRPGNDDQSDKLKIEDCLVSLCVLGLSCSRETPSSRTATRDIIKQLHAIKQGLLCCRES